MIPYNLKEVLELNNISFNASQNNIRISCPFCSSKKVNKNMGINLSEEKFNCFSCGVHGRGATQFHAYLNNISTKDAYQELMTQLGYFNSGNNSKSFPKRERTAPQIEAPVMQSTEAKDDVKNKTYTMMISRMKLSKSHLEDLLSRGFTEEEIQNLGYVSYPKALDEGITPEYFDIPKYLTNHGAELNGIPGFYRTKNKNVWTLPKKKGGIMVYYRNFYNEITGIQIRKNNEDIKYDEETGEHEQKYTWLSSNGFKDGCKATSKVHFACDFEWNKEKMQFQPVIKNGIIVLTEGAMKADLTHAITALPLMAVPGVSCAFEALKKTIPLLKDIGLKKIVIAYDMDKVMNINVLESLEKMKKLIISFGVDVDDLYWSNEVVNTDGSHEQMDTAKTFVFTSETLSANIEASKLQHTLSRIISVNRNEILFALSSSKELTDENKNNFAMLKEACKKAGLNCKPVFWSLNLKGIDDYYACKQRNVSYVRK